MEKFGMSINHRPPTAHYYTKFPPIYNALLCMMRIHRLTLFAQIYRGFSPKMALSLHSKCPKKSLKERSLTA